MGLTRRAFIQSAGAAAAGVAVGRSGLIGGEGSAAGGPNIVVIMVDSLRVDHAYGNRARTPNIDVLLRDGLRFTRAFPEAMPTVPARNSLLTGRRMFPFRGWRDYRGLPRAPGWAPIHNVAETFTSRLQEAGYWTGYVTDNPFLGWAQPYDRLRRSFDLFVRHGGQLGAARPPSTVSGRELRRWIHPAIDNPGIRDRVRKYLANGGYSDDDSRSFAARVFRSGVGALERAARQQPFALIVDTYEPHEPWTPPRHYIREYGDRGYRGPEPAMPRYKRVSKWLDNGNRDLVLGRLRALYAAEVTMTDRWLGVFLERVYALGLEGDTVIALVADHGIQLGEHGWTGKISVALHPVLIRVPFVIVDPGRRRAGEESDYFASLHDLGPTLLSMAGVRAPERMGGVDLSPLLSGARPPARPFAYGGYGENHYLRTSRWAYISDNRMRHPQLYDLRRDPGEGNNVARRHPGVVRELRETVIERARGRPPFYGT
ncbi:MAG TPA: sulfatase [Thermoleophilaceae bacterium]|nr:sulfatase [Thermoleophilaceae bacterium]